MIKHQMQAFLHRESKRRKGRAREILSQAADNPTEANLIAATRVFGHGEFNWFHRHF